MQDNYFKCFVFHITDAFEDKPKFGVVILNHTLEHTAASDVVSVISLIFFIIIGASIPFFFCLPVQLSCSI